VEAPQAVTQKGIADSIDIRVTHVPRSVRKLDEEGLIYESVMHIEGLDKRRKAYFLTEKGMYQANEIKRGLEERMVPYRDSQGNVQKIKIIKIKDETGLKLDVLDFIKLLDKEGILNQSSMELLSTHSGTKSEEKLQKIFDFPHKVPDIENFVGREKEIRTLSDWVEDESVVMISIFGDQGIGKTSLLAHLISDYRGKTSVFWFVFGKGDEFEKMRDFLSDFFEKLNRNELKTILHRKKASIGDIINGTTSSIVGTDTILVFDSFDSADLESKKFINLLSSDLKAISGSKIILMHQRPSKHYIKSMGSEHFKKLELKGMDKASCKILLGQKKLKKDELERIYKLTEGNPLSLKLIKSEDVKDLEKSGKYTPDELTLIRYLKSLEKISD
jgi:GTPase SAR1 family protein